MSDESLNENNWFKLLSNIMKIPKIRVNRNEFLLKEFGNFCSESQMQQILELGTIKAGVSLDILDRAASGVIKFHTATSTIKAAALGIPGGFAMIATVPVDIAQLYFHVLVLSQKLAYIYGYPSFDENEADDEFLYYMTLFIGVMHGVDVARTALKEVSKIAIEATIKKLPTVALTKTAYYPIIKKIAGALGVKITKRSFARSISKVIPVISAIISGGINLVTFKPMANKLKENLRDQYMLMMFQIENK